MWTCTCRGNRRKGIEALLKSRKGCEKRLLFPRITTIQRLVKEDDGARMSENCSVCFSVFSVSVAASEKRSPFTEEFDLSRSPYCETPNPVHVEPGSWSRSNVASGSPKILVSLYLQQFVLQNAPEASTAACPSFATFNTSQTTHTSPVQVVSNPSTLQHP